MRWRCSLLTAAATAGLCWPLAAQSAAPSSEARCAGVQNYRIVSERSAGTKKQALATDDDGRVLLLSLSEGGHVSDYEPLGFEQAFPADFPFRASLPADQVLMTLRRVSCAEQGWRLWIALTLGFEDVPRHKGVPPLASHLYVFRQPAARDGEAMVLSETFREVNELVVDDINGDQRTDIAVLYADAGAGPWMKIWQVSDAGKIQAISLDDVKRDLAAAPGYVEIGLGDYRHGGELLYTEQRLPTSKGWRVTRRYYDWHNEKQRYELSEVVQTDETTLK
jgi:hypothetical protein